MRWMSACFRRVGKLAIFNAVEVLIEHGDEVIVPVPYWVSYKDIIEFAGGTCGVCRDERGGELPRDRGDD